MCSPGMSTTARPLVRPGRQYRMVARKVTSGVSSDYQSTDARSQSIINSSVWSVRDVCEVRSAGIRLGLGRQQDSSDQGERDTGELERGGALAQQQDAKQSGQRGAGGHQRNDD